MKYCECEPCKSLYDTKEPTFDEIINPHNEIWEDDWDAANIGIYQPKHEKREKPMFKITQYLIRTALLFGALWLVLWIPTAIFNLIKPLLP